MAANVKSWSIMSVYLGVTAGLGRHYHRCHCYYRQQSITSSRASIKKCQERPRMADSVVVVVIAAIFVIVVVSK